MVKVATVQDLQRDALDLIDQAADAHEPVLILADGSKPAAVLVAYEDFAGYEETAYLLRSPENAKRLRESIRELEAGNGVERSLIE